MKADYQSKNGETRRGGRWSFRLLTNDALERAYEAIVEEMASRKNEDPGVFPEGLWSIVNRNDRALGTDARDALKRDRWWMFWLGLGGGFAFGVVLKSWFG